MRLSVLEAPGHRVTPEHHLSDVVHIAIWYTHVAQKMAHVGQHLCYRIAHMLLCLTAGYHLRYVLLQSGLCQVPVQALAQILQAFTLFHGERP